MSHPVSRACSLALALLAGLPGALSAQGSYIGEATVISPPTATGAYGPYPETTQPPVAGAPFVQEELDALLAPVALYPDQLLAQVLMAATYPLDVVEAARFLKQNPGLAGGALDNALADRRWDPSVLSLAAFPQVLDMMSDRLEWTRRLGEAFLADQNRVMQTVQELRARAQYAGNLYDTPEQRVLVEDRTIVIEPARAEFIYVPTYDPTVVYGAWWAPDYVPFYWGPPGIYYPTITAGLVGFGIAYRVGSNHWGWARPDWRRRHIAIDARSNRFIERRPYYRDGVRDGWWQYRGDRRREAFRDGQGYRPPASAQAVPNRDGRPARGDFRAAPDRPRAGLPDSRPPTQGGAAAGASSRGEGRTSRVPSAEPRPPAVNAMPAPVGPARIEGRNGGRGPALEGRAALQRDAAPRVAPAPQTAVPHRPAGESRPIVQGPPPGASPGPQVAPGRVAPASSAVPPASSGAPERGEGGPRPQNNAGERRGGRDRQ